MGELINITQEVIKMKQIPERTKDVLTLLYGQLAILAETSAQLKDDPEKLCMVTREMNEVARTCFENYRYNGDKFNLF